ncbi:hypothetical protein ACIO6U_11795 [Streptomyces sp. NPDC087422]|uniref:hypothetical protein n=1 Tax=Streptomyces sp. NPDC087422 TaxID=3365786 RepID=UPI0038140003
MTSTADHDAHPEVAEISDLAEGLLRPERATEVTEHIAGCSLCADVRDSLEEIRGLLGTLPGPQRMPADIAGRIDAALAAEALLDATTPDVPRGTSRPSPKPAPTPTHVPRGTSTGPDGHASGSAGPGRTGRRWRRGLLVAASAVVVVGLGVTIYHVGDDTTSQSDATASSKKADTVADPIAVQVRELLDEAAPNHAAGESDSPMLSGPGVSSEGATMSPDRAVPTIPPCVLKATQRTGPALAAERESFHGTDSYLVVLPHPSDASAVDAFVVSAACTATSPGAVLFRSTYPR